VTIYANEMPTDVVDAIEQIAAREIVELQKLREHPDARLTDEVCFRLRLLLDLVTEARKEQRDQIKFVAKLPDLPEE